MEKNGEGAVGEEQNQVQETKEYESDLKELKEIIKKQEERIQKLQSNAFQLANYYFVFQGVILTVVCKPSALKCSDKLIPFVFSVSVAVLNLFALILIGLKYKDGLGQQHKNKSDRDNLIRLIKELSHSKDRATGSSEGSGASQGIQHRPMTDPHRNNRRYSIYFVFCIAIFVVVAFITAFACLKIPCREDESNTLSGDEKCIKPSDCGKYIRLCTGN